MDDPVCVACGRGLSLEEIERGAFKHLGGRLYCAECVEALRTSRRPARCKNCGASQRPLELEGKLLCGECGAEFRSQAPAPEPKTTTPPKSRRPVKRCPYCGAILLADALKCRYCGSALTREARDLAASAQQNSRLRFWLGCSLSASLFLFAFLVYVLATRSGQSRPQAASKPGGQREDELVRQLREEVATLRKELAGLKSQPAPARSGTSTRPTAPKPPTRPAHRAATKVAAQPKAIRPKPVAPRPSSKTVVARPKPKTTTKAARPTPKPRPKGPTLAELAAKAYPAFEAEFEKLHKQRRFAQAVAASRRFVAAYLGTPAADKAQARQQQLRQELDRIREDHARRFRKALDGGDLAAAQRIVAELKLYDAPEIRDDAQQMLAAIRAAEEEPARRMARYLSQWQTPPDVARLLRQLKSEKEWTKRSQAAQELARIGHRSALGGLIAALKDPEWYVRVRAINAIEEIGDPIALPDLLPLIKSSFPVIYDPAARAVRSLAAASREKYAEAWKLVGPDEVGKQIAEALRLPGKERSAVTTRYQVALIEALALLGSKDATEALTPLTRSSDPAVSKAAALAVEKLTGKAPAPPGAARPGGTAPANSRPAAEARAKPSHQSGPPAPRAPEPAPAAAPPQSRRAAAALRVEPVRTPLRAAPGLRVEPVRTPLRAAPGRLAPAALAPPVAAPRARPAPKGLVPPPAGIPPALTEKLSARRAEAAKGREGLLPVAVEPRRAATVPRVERASASANVVQVPSGGAGSAPAPRAERAVGGGPLAAAPGARPKGGPGLALPVEEKLKATPAATKGPGAPRAANAPSPKATGGPSRVPPPGWKPARRKVVITGQAEEPTDDGLVPIGVRDSHGLRVGDKVDVLVDGKVVCGGKVVGTEPFRILLEVLDEPSRAGRISKCEVVIRVRE